MVKALVVTKEGSIYRRFIKLNHLNPEDFPWVYESIRLRGHKDCFAFMLYGSNAMLDNYDYSYMLANDIQPLYL